MSKPRGFIDPIDLGYGIELEDLGKQTPNFMQEGP
ncbi:MAG: hypothetical protein CM15mP12_8740 [Gammaproteobacteria bacterium]|nr:MAG: hypothetical protein CM15mP12_8740 [Gammaproteobacteria bacterium]